MVRRTNMYTYKDGYETSKLYTKIVINKQRKSHKYLKSVQVGQNLSMLRI
jgi:hypothetical protein